MRRLTYALLILVLIVASAATLRAQAAPTPSPPTSSGRSSVSGAPSLSPDGRWAVVGVTAWNVKEEKPSTDLWLVSTDGRESRQLTTHEGGESGPAWSPDGKWIAFEARRGDDTQRADLSAAARRRGATPAHVGAHRRVGGEVVPRQQARGVHQPGVARPRGLGRPGPAPEGARRLEDDRPDVGQGPDPLLGSLARRPRGARVRGRYRGWRPAGR